MEGLLSKSHGNKLNDDLFASVSDGYDIIALTETHLGPDPDIHLPHWGESWCANVHVRASNMEDDKCGA